jgi:hypothetical protein
MPRVTRQDALKEILTEMGIPVEDEGQPLQEDSSGEQAEIAPALAFAGKALAGHAIGKVAEKALGGKKKPNTGGAQTPANEGDEAEDEGAEEFTEADMMELQGLLDTAAKVAGGILGSKVAGMVPAVARVDRDSWGERRESRPEEVEGVPMLEDFRRMMDMPSLEEQRQSVEESLADLDQLAYVAVLSEMAQVHPTHFVQMSEAELRQVGDALGYRMFNAALIEQVATQLAEGGKGKIIKGLAALAGSKTVRKSVKQLGKSAVKNVRARMDRSTEQVRTGSAQAAQQTEGAKSFRERLSRRLEESCEETCEEDCTTCATENCEERTEEASPQQGGFRERLEALQYERTRPPEIKERDEIRESLRRHLRRR